MQLRYDDLIRQTHDLKSSMPSGTEKDTYFTLHKRLKNVDLKKTALVFGKWLSDILLVVVSDNEGNILATGGDPSGDVFTPESGSSSQDNRLIEADPSPSTLVSSEQRKSPISRCISRGSALPFSFESPFDEKLFAAGGKPTVHIGGCMISRAFLKEKPSEGLMGAIGRALLANADALCAAATPMMNNVFDV